MTLVLGASLCAQAQTTPVGLWKTIDDDGVTAKSWVRISDPGNGKLTGKVEKILDPAMQDAKCDKCTDDRKDQAILGMVLFTGLTQDLDEKDVWQNARILDPKRGEEFRMRVQMIEGGKKLLMRGYFGPFYRTQEWLRLE
ncbi:MAG TPA: DUF2147 domain-containing protein [Burkholderiaceae bacterium]|nr:DUF2147 domain-containing protein [Burkholderiaceae bacterium]